MIRFNFKNLLLAAFGAFAMQGVHAQLSVDISLTPEQMVQNLVGPGVQISNVTVTACDSSYGYYQSAGTEIGSSQGLLLTTGKALYAVGPNNSIGNCSTSAGTCDFFDNDCPGSALLNLAQSRTTYDATQFEFDIVPQGDSLKFKYTFASEEYNEWVGSQFNDVFGFYISGPGIGTDVNIALIPTTGQVVSINTINALNNQAFYWSTGDDEFRAMTGVTVTNEVVTGTYANLQLEKLIGNVEGTILSSSLPYITTVGVLDDLTIDGTLQVNTHANIYSLEVSLTNYAENTSSTTKSWTVPVVLSISGTKLLTWNGEPGISSNVYLVSSTDIRTLIAQTTLTSYSIAQYAGLSVRCLIISRGAFSNILTASLPLAVNDVSINPVDYITTAINSITDISNIIKSVNSQSKTFTTPYVQISNVSISRFVNISGSQYAQAVQDKPFVMIFSPSGGNVTLPSSILIPVINTAPIIYFTGSVGTTTTYYVDNSQNKYTIKFQQYSIAINDISYSIGDIFTFGNNNYTLGFLGSAVGIYVPPTIVIDHTFNSIRNNRSYYDVDYNLSEKDRIETLHLQGCLHTRPCKKHYKTYAEKTLAKRNNIITKCYSPDPC
jgi:hypothetical protein